MTSFEVAPLEDRIATGYRDLSPQERRAADVAAALDAYTAAVLALARTHAAAPVETLGEKAR